MDGYLFVHSEIGQYTVLPFCTITARTLQIPAQGIKLLFCNSEYDYCRGVERAELDLVFLFQHGENFGCLLFPYIPSFHRRTVLNQFYIRIIDIAPKYSVATVLRTSWVDSARVLQVPSL